MAPEQFAGKGASVRSDLYALGLVLYELFTGKRAFDAVTIAGYRKKHAEDTPTLPSAVLPDFDPAVERVILRCIEKDPAQRPSSATQVAAALPGGDPLAAALAAGETPSPEMVAAAGEKGAISPSTARRLLLALAAAIVLSIFLTPRANIAAFVGVEKSPELLRERAREILKRRGPDAEARRLRERVPHRRRLSPLGRGEPPPRRGPLARRRLLRLSAGPASADADSRGYRAVSAAASDSRRTAPAAGGHGRRSRWILAAGS